MQATTSPTADDRPFTSSHLTVMVLTGLVVFLDGFDLVGISYVGPAMMKALDMTKPMFGAALSSSLFGLTIGAFAAGLIGDRFGRRPTLIGCAVVFALGSIATALSWDAHSLLASRVLTGLGLGGATPIAVALVSECMPRRLRASLVIIIYTNISFGGIVAGYVSSATLSWGWPMIFWIGGILPLLIVPLLIAFLPESSEFLHARQRGLGTNAPVRGANPLRGLFTSSFAVITGVLWFTFFAALITLYFYQTWLPTLLIDSGMSVREVVLIGLTGQVGVITGSVIFARVASFVRPFVMVGCCYIMGAVVVLLFAVLGNSLWMWLPVSFLAGAFLPGTQNSCNGVTSLVYPPAIRATGVGWAIGVGRIGAIVGPAIAGVLLGLGWSDADLFKLAAVGPALAAVGCFWVAWLLARPALPDPEAADALLAHTRTPHDATLDA